jgi:hypothetical protein
MKYAYILTNTNFGFERIDSIQYGAGAKERAMQESTQREMRIVRVLTKTALTLAAGQPLPRRYIH